MEVQVNGERSEIPATSSLEDLVRQLSLSPARIAIELNQQVVRQDAWTNTLLNENDRIEIVHFVGGGSEPIVRRPHQRFAPSGGRFVL